MYHQHLFQVLLSPDPSAFSEQFVAYINSVIRRGTLPLHTDIGTDYYRLSVHFLGRLCLGSRSPSVLGFLPVFFIAIAIAACCAALAASSTSFSPKNPMPSSRGWKISYINMIMLPGCPTMLKHSLAWKIQGRRPRQTTDQLTLERPDPHVWDLGDL